MFEWLKRRERLRQIKKQAERYVAKQYAPTFPYEELFHKPFIPKEEQTPVQSEPEGKFSRVPNQSYDNPEHSGVKYSRRPVDTYDSEQVQSLLRNAQSGTISEISRRLGDCTNISFVDKMLELIRVKELKDTDVYKAAQLDRRLYSKIISDSSYSPSKDTCISIAFALKLTLDEAKDLISRAGYTFSHSNKRDVIIEYFFLEQIYDIFDINEVLYKFGEKTLGRN